jgi:hypothetical protein
MGWRAIVALFLSAVSTAQTQKNKAMPENVGSFSQQEQEDIREVAFRYQFRHNSSIQGNKAAVYCLSVEKGADPPDSFVKRFAGHTPTVRKVSECTADPYKGVVDQYTGKRGLIFQVKGIKWISQAEAEVFGGYFEDGLSASGNTYTVTKTKGTWRVSKAWMNWLS